MALEADRTIVTILLKGDSSLRTGGQVSTLNNPLWFYKTLLTASRENVVRLRIITMEQ